MIEPKIRGFFAGWIVIIWFSLPFVFIPRYGPRILNWINHKIDDLNHLSQIYNQRKCGNCNTLLEQVPNMNHPMILCPKCNKGAFKKWKA